MKKSKPDPFDRFFNYSWILVFLLPFALYCSALSLGFVFFDDDVLILENQQVIHDPGSLGKIFTTDVFIGKTVPYYRPLLNVALMIGARASGTNPGGYHLVSVLVHCLNCLSLLWLLTLLGLSKPKALTGSLLFSIHPLISNAVFWIPAVNDLLITLFALLSFATFLLFIRQKNWKYLLLHILTFAGAFFSKESAVALPFLFLLYLFLSKKRIMEPGYFPVYLSWLTVILVWFFLRRSAIGVLQGDEQGIGAIIKNLPFLPEIVSKFFLPYDLPVMPVFSVFYTVSGILIMVFVIVLFFMAGKKDSMVLFLGLTWFLAFAIPNMFLRQYNTNDSFDYLEHRACLPSAGLLMMILAMVPEAWVDLRERTARIAIPLLLFILALFTLLQEGKYKDGEAYWQSILKVSPDRAWFHHLYGRYCFKQQDFTKFEEQLHEAVRIKPYGTFYYNLGMIELMQKRKFESAYGYFTKAIEMGETKPEVMRNFVNLCIESAGALSKNGANDKASERIEAALKYDPANTVALMNLALFSLNLGDNIKAANLWKKVVQIDPSAINAWKNLFLFYSNSADHRDSSSYFAAQYIKFGGKQEDLTSRQKL
ncbi:MAG: tetratricopeptide repeat protein [Bacteroidota bacterium]